jgi:type IV pilus assembly protein PilA
MRTESSHGFTLVELLIVVLIIGLLATIAIPIFNGQRDKARNAVAMSNVRTAYIAAQTHYTVKETFIGFTLAEMKKTDSNLDGYQCNGSGCLPAHPEGVWAPYGTGTGPTSAKPGKNADPASILIYWDGIWAEKGQRMHVCAASQGDRAYCIEQSYAPSLGAPYTAYGVDPRSIGYASGKAYNERPTSWKE